MFEQAAEVLIPNLAHISANDAMKVGAAFALSRAFDDESLREFEEHLLTLLPVCSDDVVIWVLESFVMGMAGTADGFYRAIERHLAPKLGKGLFEAEYLKTMLSCFKRAEIMGFDTSRIFVRA